MESSQNQKRIASVEKYKTKLLNRAERKSNLAKESAKKHRDAYKDLEKNGKYSKTYQEYIDKEIGNPLDDFEFGSDDETPEEAKERRFNNAVNFGTNFVQRAILMNDSVANRNISELMASHDTRAKESSKRAKAYIAARSDILDIPVSETTKKKDIRKAYKKSYKTNLYRHGG